MTEHPEFRSKIAVETTDEAGNTTTNGYMDSAFEKRACEQVAAIRAEERQILKRRTDFKPL